MTDRETLAALVERVEQATGPDRELDAEIAVAVTPGMFRDGESVGFTGEGDMRPPLPYTGSLDAALTLYRKPPEMVPSCPRKAVAAALRAMMEEMGDD